MDGNVSLMCRTHASCRHTFSCASVGKLLCVYVCALFRYSNRFCFRVVFFCFVFVFGAMVAVKVILYVLLVMHWVACGWHLLADLEDADQSW